MATTSKGSARKPKRASNSKPRDNCERFDQRLVLRRWMFSLFGAKNLQDLTVDGNWDEYEGFSEEGQTVFLPLVSNRKSNHSSLSKEVLAEYDGNIVRHWKDITARRQESGRQLLPKYFQYLALLFTEIYLDRYFYDVERLRLDLN